jgi:ribulose-bisphosphate carboxylase large chain
MRLPGADAIIYPDYAGRFSFSEEECRSVMQGTAVPMGHLKPIFPAPGGGMNLGRIPEMNRFYGCEVIYLIGGNLHRGGADLTENTRNFLEIVEVESKKSG